MFVLPIARCPLPGTVPFFEDEKEGQSREAGFTLIEVLLAVAVLSVVSMMVSMSFSSTFRVVETVADDGDREHLARSCLSMIAQDLVTVRRETFPSFAGRNGDVSGQPADILAFSSSGHRRSQPNAPETDLTRVLYAREETRLVRYEIANPYIIAVDAVEQTELANQVAGFNVRYYDREAKAWLDAWGGQGRAGLPGGAMIELTLLNGRKEPRTYTTYVSFPWQAG